MDAEAPPEQRHPSHQQPGGHHELRYGGISETAQSVLEKIGETPKVRPNPGGVIPGTRFEREWKGTIHVVIATDTGFEYNGQNYRSLSGAAFAITGTQWNGKKFFGVQT